MRWRVLGIIFFTGVMVYGLVGALGLERDDQVRALLWLLGGLVVHDLIFMPVLFAGGKLLQRVPRRPRVALKASSIIFGSVLLTTLPTWLARGRDMTEPSLLPQDYSKNLLIVLVLAGIFYLLTLLYRTSPRSTPEGNDHQERDET